jgi:hypothetical protein
VVLAAWLQVSILAQNLSFCGSCIVPTYLTQLSLDSKFELLKIHIVTLPMTIVAPNIWKISWIPSPNKNELNIAAAINRKPSIVLTIGAPKSRIDDTCSRLPNSIIPQENTTQI